MNHMSQVAFTTLDHGELVFAGSESPKVLLVDSVFETISVKRLTLHRNIFRSVWLRLKKQRELQFANPDCAVYWCAVDRSTGYLCVSNLLLPDSANNDVTRFIEQSNHLQFMCSQLMSIGNSLPSRYHQVLLVLNSPVGIRHVYFIDHKPVFTRLLPPNSSAADYVEPLQATLQHLLNRSMLAAEPTILCHGLCESAQAAIAQKWSASSVASLMSALDNQTNKTLPMSSLAVEAYMAKRLQRWFVGQLPAYWSGKLERYRFRDASRRGTMMACVLVMVVASGLLAFKLNDWSSLLRTRAAIKVTAGNTQVLSDEASAFSTAPQLTAQRLQRLDLLRSLQPAGPDVLLSAVSTVFEAHPHVSLNHISWFTVVSNDEFQLQTQVAHRDRLSIDAVNPDFLSVLITGNIQAASLSQQQALFSAFKVELLSLQGVGDLIEEQTPITQWRMPSSTSIHESGVATDSFTLRFLLNDVSS